MFLDKFLRKCQARYDSGDFQTLTSLLRYNLRERSPKYTALMELNVEFNALKRAFLQEHLSYQDYKEREKNIVTGLKKIMDTIRNNDLRKRANAVHREIRFPIFVLSSSLEKIPENVLLFDLLNFTKKEVTYWTNFESNFSDVKTEIVVFENQNISQEQVPERTQLMLQFIDNQKYVIHFGEEWEGLGTDILQAKNKYELNSRLSEIIQFIETYQT